MTSTASPPKRTVRHAGASRVRRSVRGLPRAFWSCVVFGVMNALAWAILTPTFQVPDEPVHVGYAQYVAETGKVPRALTARIFPSRDETLAYEQVPFSLLGRPTWSANSDRALERAISGPFRHDAEGGAGYAANNPPLYYYAEAVPYRIAASGNFIDRLFAMRFFSALLAGLTVGFVFLFIRELLPRDPLAWTIGALAVALQPVFGFIGGGVNNDNLLWLFGAVVLWLVARIFRHGLTPRRGLAIGAALGAGVLTKASMLGLAPGVALALATCAWRARPHWRPALGGLVGAAGASLIPVLGWLALQSSLFERSANSSAGGLTTVTHTSLSGQLSYLWQFFLPRLGFMNDWFTHHPRYPLWDTYVQGFVGRFGWFEYGFPLWANAVGLIVIACLIVLAGAGLVRARVVFTPRLMELLSYLALLGGMLLLVGIAGYRYRVDSGQNFEQARYLFPVIGLWGGLVAVAVRSAGRRWAPVLAVLLAVVFLGWDLFAQLLTTARYYD